jgi:hypothetical protein
MRKISFLTVWSELAFAFSYFKKQKDKYILHFEPLKKVYTRFYNICTLEADDIYEYLKLYGDRFLPRNYMTTQLK